MIEFVTMDAKECPYCKGELHVIEKDYYMQMQCGTCNKFFQIACGCSLQNGNKTLGKIRGKKQ